MLVKQPFISYVKIWFIIQLMANHLYTIAYMDGCFRFQVHNYTKPIGSMELVYLPTFGRFSWATTFCVCVFFPATTRANIYGLNKALLRNDAFTLGTVNSFKSYPFLYRFSLKTQHIYIYIMLYGYNQFYIGYTLEL